MANDMIIPGKSKLPAHLADWDDEVGSNIVTRAGPPQLTFPGKTWTLNIGGEKVKLEKTNDDGDVVAIPILNCVILGYAPDRGRSYYPSAYDRDNPGPPLCWSDDGKAPHESVPIADKQAKKCATCKWSQKNSRPTDNGKGAVACSEHRYIALVPLAGLADEKPTVFRMRIAVTSDWDKKSPDEAAKNWFAFSNYTSHLQASNIKHTAQVVTRMKFDRNAEYPKIFFQSSRYIEPDEKAAVKALLADRASWEGLLVSDFTPVAPAADDDDDDAPVAPKKLKAAPVDDGEEPSPPPKKAKAKPAPVAEDDDEEPPPPPVKKKPAPVADDDDDAPPPPKKKAAPVAEDDDDDPPPPPVKKKSAPAADVPKGTGGKAGVKGLLSAWGDD